MRTSPAVCLVVALVLMDWSPTTGAEETTSLEIPLCKVGKGEDVLVSTSVDRIALVTIVVPARREEGIDRAALAMQGFIKRITGAYPHIEEDTLTPEGRAFYLGHCRQSRESDLPPKELGAEAFAIRLRDGNVFFCGRIPSAVEFAVYSFLEEFLGVRWFLPGPLGEYIPKLKDGDFSVRAREIVRGPNRSPRVLAGEGWGMFEEWASWKRHNRLSVTDNIPQGVTPNLPWMIAFNGMYKIFPRGKYEESHPEYFPLLNGERWFPPLYDDPFIVFCWMPCLSNPGVIRTTVEFLRRWFDDHPGDVGFPLGMDDVSRLCQCDDCRALDPGERPGADRFFWFVNKVARELGKTHPNRQIRTLINYYWDPPKSIAKFEPNVYAYLPREEARWYVPERREREYAISNRWIDSGISTKLNRYSYWGGNWVMPRYFPHLLAEAVKRDHAQGFRGLYAECHLSWQHAGPMLWAASKLLWDCSLDIDELLNEYFTKMYGAAAEDMAAYYDLLEQTWLDGHAELKEPSGDSYGGFLAGGHAMTPEQIAQLNELLTRARGAADTEAARQRIDLVAAGLQYCEYIVREARAVKALERLEVKDRASARTAVERLIHFDELVDERRVFCDRIFHRADVVGQSLQGLARVNGEFSEVGLGRRWGRLESLADSPRRRVLKWHKDQGPETWRQLKARIDTSTAPQTLRRLYAELDGKRSASVGADAAGVEGWTMNSPREEIRPEFSIESLSGSGPSDILAISAGDREAIDGAWMKVFPIVGGRHYRFSALRRTENVETPRRCAIVKITWQDDNGGLVQGEQDRARPEYPLDQRTGSSGWTEVGDTYRVPEKATQAKVELHLRWTKGSVRWRDIQLIETSPPKPRLVRLAAVHFRPKEGQTSLEKCELFAPLIAEAAEQRTDLVCLPESLTYYGSSRSMAECAEPIPGPSSNYFAQLAKKHDLYIVAGLTEREGAVVYNTAVMVGPEGTLVGKYRKVCLPREEIEAGVTPGEMYPVFETRFGKVGLMVCWDVHFPEVARNLSNNGAEVIAMPIWGGNPALARARSIENQLYLVTSTYTGIESDSMVSGIWDHKGNLLVKNGADWGKVLVTEIDLSKRTHWSWLGDFKARIERERPGGFRSR